MAHHLDFTKGKPAIAYRGELPWHGMGTEITNDMTLDQMIVEAGLDYSIIEMPSVYNGGTEDDPEYFLTPNRKDLIRSDNRMWISEMSGNRYEVRQPKQIVEFFRDLCDFGGFEIVTLGALFDGKRVWAQAQRKGGASELDGMHKPKIFLAEGYDGTLATIAKFADERIVCANTMGIALGENSGQIKISHATKFNEEKVKTQLGSIDRVFSEYLEKLTLLSKVKMTDDFKIRFFSKLFAPKVFEEPKLWRKAPMDFEKASTASKNVVADLLKCDEPGGSPGSDILPNTLYNAMQTVTYYVDHVARTKGEGRFASAVFGQGANRKQEAFDIALECVK